MKKSAPIAATIAVAALSVTNGAFAETIEVSFDRGLLETAEGREAIYELFVEEAYEACRNQLGTTRPLVSVSVCTSDYVDSLVDDLGDAEIKAMNARGWRSAL